MQVCQSIIHSCEQNKALNRKHQLKSTHQSLCSRVRLIHAQIIANMFLKINYILYTVHIYLPLLPLLIDITSTKPLNQSFVKAAGVLQLDARAGLVHRANEKTSNTIQAEGCVGQATELTRRGFIRRQECFS